MSPPDAATDRQPITTRHANGVADTGATGDRWFPFAIAIGATFAPLNSTMIAIALPDIQRNLGVPVSSTAWLVTLYLVAMAAGQPVGGRLGDQLGRRRVYLVGLAWFTMASIGCALAPSLPILILFRTQQALAGALSFPNIAAMIRESVPSHRQGAGFGLIGLASSAAAAIGPPLGGLLVGAAGWSSVFWVNVPLGCLALAIGWRSVPRVATHHTVRAFDVVGTGLLALSLGIVILVPSVPTSQGIAFALATVIGAAVVGAGFVRHERRIPHPVIDIALFQHAPFVAACTSQALGNLVMYTTLLALPMFLESVLGRSLREVGLMLVALSAFSALLGPVGGRWADRAGRWLPAVTGGGALLIGTSVVSLGVHTASIAIIVSGLAMMGLGLGISGAALIAAATSSVPIEQAGSASGVFSTSRYVGSILGSTMLAAVLTHATGDTGQHRFSILFAGLGIAAALACIANTRIGGRPSVKALSTTHSGAR